MAFSGRLARGNAVEITADTAIGMSPSGAIVVGRVAVVCLATKNIATTDGATNTHLTVTDTVGNTWTKLGEYTETAAGAADDGSTVSLWVTKVTTEIAITDTITASLSGSIADKCIACMEAIAPAGVALEQLGVGQNAMAATVTGMPSREYLFIGGAAAVGTDNAKTPDADYVEYGDLRSRNVATAITSHLQVRIATLTADTVTSTGWTGTQPIALLAALYELPADQAVTGSTLTTGVALTTPTVAGTGGGFSISGVSGTISHGSSVTISGSGFGTKSTAAPLIWDDCSGTSIGALWDGGWPDANTTYNANYRSVQRSMATAHSHVSKYLCGSHYGESGFNAGYNVLVWHTRTISLPQKLFVSWYHRYDDAWITGLGSPPDDNLKIWDYSTTGPYEMPQNWYQDYGELGYWKLNDDGTSLESPDANGHSMVFWDGATNPMGGTWIKQEMEILLTASTGLGGGGKIDVWDNGDSVIRYRGATDRYSGTTRSIVVGGYSRGRNTNNWRYFNDIYVDLFWARVVIGNASTYGACTIRETQPITAWSASSIGITLNAGKLTGSPYIYVIDNAGTVSPGFQVTLGGGGGPDQFISLP